MLLAGEDLLPPLGRLCVSAAGSRKPRPYSASTYKPIWFIGVRITSVFPLCFCQAKTTYLSEGKQRENNGHSDHHKCALAVFAWCPCIRGYSAETIEKYVQDVRALATSLGGRRPWNTSSLEVYRLIQSPKILYGAKSGSSRVQKSGSRKKLCEVQRRACCKIEFWKIRSKKKLARTVELAVFANFFKVQIFFSGLKTAFCNRSLWFGRRPWTSDLLIMSR